MATMVRAECAPKKAGHFYFQIWPKFKSEEEDLEMKSKIFPTQFNKVEAQIGAYT